MRKRGLIWLILSICLVLTGCESKGGNVKADELALEIRGEYLAAQTISSTCQVTADYGVRVYDFTLSAVVAQESTQITVVAPELVAGITVTIYGKDSDLAYDGLLLNMGSFQNGLNPLSAIPGIFDAVRTGFIDVCALEEYDEGTQLRVFCRNPDAQVGTGEELTLWFDVETHALLQAEVSNDGYRVIRCVFSELTKE